MAQKRVQEAPDTAAAAVVRNTARRHLTPEQPNQTAANQAGLWALITTKTRRNMGTVLEKKPSIHTAISLPSSTVATLE